MKDIPKKKTRDASISPYGFDSILLQAFKRGYDSYRDSKIVITFYNANGRRVSVLTEKDKNEIIIISVFTNRIKDDFKNNYITVKNRINLWYYWSLPALGEEGNEKPPRKKIVYICQKSRKKRQNKIYKKGIKCTVIFNSHKLLEMARHQHTHIEKVH